MFTFFYILICIAALTGLPIGFFSKKYHVHLPAAAMSTTALFAMALVHACGLYPATPSGFLVNVPVVALPYLLLFCLGTKLHKGAQGMASRSTRRFQYAMIGACSAAFACWIFIQAGHHLFDTGGHFWDIPSVLMTQSNMAFDAFSLEGLKAMFGLGIGGGLLFFWLLCNGFWYVFVLLSAGLGLWLASRESSRPIESRAAL